MDLSNLKAVKGSIKRVKRIGRGEGSGHGKTSCHGHKGQLARSGGRSRRGKEGGQMPLYRRLPKRGFSHERFSVDINVVNVASLNLFENGATVTTQDLYSRGIIRKRQLKTKILGDGLLEKKLTVCADFFSKSALEKIKALGGVCMADGKVVDKLAVKKVYVRPVAKVVEPVAKAEKAEKGEGKEKKAEGKKKAAAAEGAEPKEKKEKAPKKAAPKPETNA